MPPTCCAEHRGTAFIDSQKRKGEAEDKIARSRERGGRSRDRTPSLRQIKSKD
jgi:hypothetical protein